MSESSQPSETAPVPSPHGSARISDTAMVGEAAAAAPLSAISVASMYASHLLRDGEIVLLVLKPSRWYVPLNCFRFVAAVVLLLLLVLQTLEVPAQFIQYYVDAGLFLITCRVMWSVLNWMGRLYVLTDRRIMRISGVFYADIFDCPLRKVGRVRVVRPYAEGILRLGTIEIYPNDVEVTGAGWQTLNQPADVLGKIESAIRRAKQCDL